MLPELQSSHEGEVEVAVVVSVLVLTNFLERQSTLGCVANYVKTRSNPNQAQVLEVSGAPRHFY